MAVSKANDRVVDLILDLKSEMHHRFTDLESRVKTIEKDQNSTAKLLTEIRSKVIDYSFRGGWVILTGVVVLIVSQAAQWLHFIK